VYRLQSTATASQSLSVYPETEVTSLDNGLRVATEDTGSKSATIALYIDAGSRFETEETNGIANFFEHMAFKVCIDGLP
jgi:processing peptidase subunit beta